MKAVPPHLRNGLSRMPLILLEGRWLNVWLGRSPSCGRAPSSPHGLVTATISAAESKASQTADACQVDRIAFSQLPAVFGQGLALGG